MNIWVNGCFDILHTGHIDLLWYAKNYLISDILYQTGVLKENNLFVGLDSDSRIKRLKGDGRPINDQYFRSKMMSSLKMVDSVVIFTDDNELEEYIKKFEIDYMVIGDHYKNKVVIGGELTKRGVIFYPTDERSSTNIIKKIKEL